MDTVFKKEEFVRTSLKELVQSIDTSILDVYYHIKDCEEIVTILYGTFDSCDVCVTANSRLAIAKNVLNRIEM